jgi:hypothetical protein
MSSLDKAVATQLSNIQAKTGKSIEELSTAVQQSGLTKHSEIRAMLQRDLGLGYGDANTLVHALLASDGERAAQAKGATSDDIVNELYAGAKAHLRPIHDALMAATTQLGPFEVLPKKGYLSLRRRKQFAMIGPPTKARVDVGLNAKGVPATERLVAMPAGGMCQYTVKITDIAEVDQELIGWIRQAYDQAG